VYRVNTDEWVQQQVDRLPAEALASYAELRTLLEVKPWSGDPVNDDNRTAQSAQSPSAKGSGWSHI
jgi:hypothetical protein